MPSESDQVVLFDLNSKPPNRGWSSNTWRIRLILNYKGIPYRTEWIEYEDVEAKLKPLELPPNPRGHPGRPAPAYTVPTVILPDGKVIMDSAAIATELERRYPTPAVSGIPSHSTSMPAAESSDPALVQTAEYAVLHAKLSKPLRSLVAARSVEIVTDYSRPKKIADLGGQSLEEFTAGIDMDQIKRSMESPMRDMSAFWDSHGGVLRPDGSLSWAAVQQLSALHYIKIIAPDLFRHIVEAEEGKGLRGLYDSAKERGWFDRNDH